MTEYELQELAFTAGELGINFSALLITLISSYLVDAYIAGSDLTRPQVTLINVLFIFTSSLFLYGSVSSFVKQLSIVEKLRVLNPEDYYPATNLVVIAVAGIFILIIVASLHFMWSVRHPKK